MTQISLTDCQLCGSTLHQKIKSQIRFPSITISHCLSDICHRQDNIDFLDYSAYAIITNGTEIKYQVYIIEDYLISASTNMSIFTDISKISNPKQTMRIYKEAIFVSKDTIKQILTKISMITTFA